MTAPLSEAQLLRIARSLRRATNDSPKGIKRSNLGEVYHSPDLDRVELQELAAIVGGSPAAYPPGLPLLPEGVEPIRAWFMVFPPRGATRPHVHAEADLVTVTGIYGEGKIRVNTLWDPRKTTDAIVKQGQTIVMHGKQLHEALPGEFKRSSLVINWKRK